MVKRKRCFFKDTWVKCGITTLLITISTIAFSQSKKGIVKGKVIDGTTYRTIFGAAVSVKKTPVVATETSADGKYFISLNKGTYSIKYSLEGFQTKTITEVKIKAGEVTYLDIIINPLAQKGNASLKKISRDSANSKDSILFNKFSKEILSSNYNFLADNNLFSEDIILEKNITPGNDKNGLLLVKRLNGIVTQNSPANPLIHTFVISGLGERYNQVLLNGSEINYFDASHRSMTLELLPAEAMEEVSVQKRGNSSIPSDFSGGSVSLKTKDFTNRNFFYILAGGSISAGTTGKAFYSDARGDFEMLALSGSKRKLPSEFPLTTSEFALSSKNIQEQVYLSQQLKNNLVPINYGKSQSGERVLIGFGRNFKLKKGAKISLVGFINQSKSEQLNEAMVQVAPDVASNPFPFNSPDKQVLFTQAKDSNYLFTSQLAGVFNASVSYGRNRISIRNFLGAQLTNSYSKRTNVYNPDEDTLAHSGINYKTQQRYFINTQISGEHALSVGGKFKMDWQATYMYLNEQRPDERNFLLRGGLSVPATYEIANPITKNSFTNSGRQWSNLKDNNFSGAFNLSFPLTVFRQPQVLGGGIYIQQNYRIFNSDLLLVNGPGYFSLNNLIAPERYYPGGLTASNFYSDVVDFYDSFGQINPGLVKPYSRANYSASSNTGAAYLKMDGRLLNQLFFHIGGRIESNSQLASNIYYKYFKGFKYPQIFPLDQNTKITSYYFLPSVNIAFEATDKLKLLTGYFKSVSRPQLQELVKYSYYDATSFMVKTGNPLLAVSTIDNFNGGINFLANASTSFSVTGFYKTIAQPIEYIVTAYGIGNRIMVPHNMPTATVKGLDASFRLKFDFSKSAFLSGVEIFGNATITRSDVNAGPVRDAAIQTVKAHKLSGSPDHSFNGGIVIHHGVALPELTILYSRTADYLKALGSGKVYTLQNGNTVSAIPDYWIKGREQLDIQLSQKLFKSKVQLIAGVNNLTGNPYIEYQDLNGNKKFDTPLVLKSNGSNGGYFVSGVDNTLINIRQQRIYYLTVSYLFK